MKELLKAVHNKLDGSGLWTSLGGRVYFDHAPQGTVFPYCVYYLINDKYEYQFDSEFQEVVLQFNIFDQSSSALNILGYYDDLRDVMDWSSLSITGYDCIKVEPEWANIEWLEEEEAWICRTQYRVLQEKQ